MNKALRSFIAIAIALTIAAGLAAALSQGGGRLLGYPAIATCAFIAFLIQWLVFLPSFYFQTEHYFDLTGSLTYIGLVLLVLLAGSDHDSRTWLVSGMVVAWAGRLGLFLFRRVKRAGKDGRFDVIKTSWPRFLVTWTLQGLWVFVTLLAALVVMTNTTRMLLDVFALVGALVWLFGFALEVVADAQKSNFNARPENSGKFVNVGLWRWSRHPNYFGEIVLWLGVAIVAVPVLSGWQWLAMISPVFVTLLLTKISGVPLLEQRADEKWGHDSAYQRYKETTSVLIPLPPRGSHA